MKDKQQQKANVEQKKPVRVEWELFNDVCFYDMWAVRPMGDRSFDSPRLFHFALKEDAEQFKALLEKSHHAVPAPMLKG